MGRPPHNRCAGQAGIGGAQVLNQLETGDTMHLPLNSPKRLIGAAAVACAAALIPVAALAATASPAAPAASTPRCATSGLVIWFSPQPGGGYAGGYYYNLNFTNLSGHACTLRGYPGVSAVGLSGQQLGSPAGWDNAKLRTVRLANRATATAQLQVADAGNYGCTATAAGLRVYPPSQFTSKVVPYPLEACARTGPVWMHARPVQNG
jgi:hypothetical protein